MADIKIEGLDELNKRFIELARLHGEEISEAMNPVRHGLRAAGEVLGQYMQNKVPRDSGELHNAIKVAITPKRYRKKGEVRYRVGVDAKKSYYAYFVEFGTGFGGELGKGRSRGKIIDPVKAEALVIHDGGGLIFRDFVEGQDPQPFVRPALAARGERAIREFEKAYAKQLNRLEKRLGRSS